MNDYKQLKQELRDEINTQVCSQVNSLVKNRLLVSIGDQFSTLTVDIFNQVMDQLWENYYEMFKH